VAAGDICGVSAGDASQALAAVTPGPGRGKITRAGGVTVVDETYNASATSTMMSLDMLAGFESGHRVAVLGDMAELGASSDELHEAVGRRLVDAGIDRAYWKGGFANAVRRGIGSRGGKLPFASFDAIDDLVEAVAHDTGDGDVVLAKASRSCGLDAFVDALVARLGPGNRPPRG
jgi:UDP-N-acetylmuramoyl-tripeptide--D-alanyl-D-alanine ligase